MHRRLIQFIFILIALLFAMDAKAGIIIKPVHNFGLVGYWDFQEGAGGNVYDKSGKGNTGTWNGTGSHWANGKIGVGGSFNGSDNDITTTEIVTSTETMSAWIKTSSKTTQNIFTSYYGGGENNQFRIESDGDVRYLTNSGNYIDVTTTGVNVSDGNWHHIVAVNNGTNAYIYTDGVQRPANNSVGSANTHDWGLIGGYAHTSQYFDGLIDEVRIYNRALSASEVERLYKSGATKIGINRLGPVSDDNPSNAFIAYVRENCAGYSPCYHSLYDWEAAYGGIDFSGCTPGDLTCANVNKTAVAKIDGPWAAADPDGAVTIDGWTTDATRYIKIYTTAEARHNGKWDDTTKYRLQTTTNGIYNKEAYVRIDGLQVKVTTAADSAIGIQDYITDAGGETRVSNCIVQGVISGGTYQTGISPYGTSVTHTAKYWNNIIYGFNATFGAGIAWVEAGTTLYAYNNTVYNCYYGLTVYGGGGSGTLVLKNNISYSNTDNYSGTYGAGSTNNLSGPAADAQIPATNKRDGVTVNFVDATNKDFHLAPADTGARDYGTSNPGSGLFSNDIDRQNRSVPWDIGADESIVAQVNSSQNNKLTDGLVGFWSFNGPDMDWNQPTAEARDTSGQGNHGDVVGATPAIGKVGQALSFNGSSNYIDLGYPSFYLIGPPVTYSAWVKPASLNSGAVMNVGTYNANAKTVIAILNGYLYAGGVNHQDIVDLSAAGNPISTNGWNHILYVIDADNSAGIYINGTKYAASGVDYIGSTGSFYIGAKTSTENYFNGSIDEVRIYNRALTVQEILRLYNMGR